jgi:hypothetical protein
MNWSRWMIDVDMDVEVKYHRLIMSSSEPYSFHSLRVDRV